jgi:uncharacterized protein
MTTSTIIPTPTPPPTGPPTLDAAEPAAVAAAFYDAYLRGDVASASVHLAPDAVLHVPGSSPVAGDFEGLDGIFGWILTSEAITAEGELRTSVVDLTGGATHATAICEVVGDRPGRATMRNRTVHVLRIDEGRIAEIWFHNWDQPSVDAFWG